MRTLRSIVVNSLAAVVVTATALGTSPAIASTARSPALPSRSAASAGPADEIVAGLGQSDGYHLFVARSTDRWAWQPVALLDPGGEDDQAWVGNTCVTGDGQTAVAVIAPWSAINAPTGIERGGIAYAVDLATDRTRVLATGVSMAYFNPGCGSGQDVALTSYLGEAEQTTRVWRVNAATGVVAATSTLSGEFTSAVPVSGTLMAAHGNRLVWLAGSRATNAAALPGQAYQLRPNRQGGVDLLAADSASSGSAWRYGGRSLHQLGTGPIGSLALQGGHAGATVLSGAAKATADAGLTLRQGDGSRTLASSQLGTAMLVAPPKAVRNVSSRLPQIVSATGTVLRQATMMPASSVIRTTSTGVGAVPLAVKRQAATTAPAPTCAVGRDNPAIQVPQPSNAQIDWAIQQAVANSLPSRPAGFDNLPGGAYSPESDFLQPLLTGGSSHVPALLVAGILAQESNFNQASWHAPAGLAGDPLIADYYGAGGVSGTINYSAADCGYGLGQITDIMNAGNSIGLTIQQRVAVDYTENIAAVVQHLARTWNQLAAYSPSITINHDSPAWLEDWYDTIWAYNSGVEPRSATYGLPAGCAVPGPTCTDSAGNWGLGWANNPVNPVFKPGRPVFLSDSYADAATPGEWAYQERVFGWMATPVLRYDPAAGADQPAYPAAAQYLQQPPVTAFCSAVDNCNPSDPNKLYCGYQASGALQYHCWWNGPVTFAGNCADSDPASICTSDRPLSDASSEPAAANPDPPVCNLDTSQVPTSTPAGHTIIVTEESGAADPGGGDINVAGCTGSRNWTAGGSFSAAYATDSQGDPLGQVDFHQLGAGFGGHMFFTHTAPPAGASTNRVTGTWQPGITATGAYQVKVFVPDVGSVADPAVYTITSSNGSTWERTINQNNYGNQWVTLGDFALGTNSVVSLTNVTGNGDYSSDLAFAAMAFVPEPGRLVHHTIDGFSNFGDAQSLDGPNPSWLAGDFTSDSTLIQMAGNLTSGLLAYPACAPETSSPNCVPPAVRTAMTSWQSAVAQSNGHPVQWLGFSRPAPPNPLPSSYLDTGTNYKVRASTNIDFIVQNNGQIAPGSYSVTATNDTGITEVPQFIRDMFSSIYSGYGIAAPDLSYSAADLQYFDGESRAVNPLGTGLAPGREYMPDQSAQLINNNTCLQVQDLAGGAIGWKALLTDDNVVNNANVWKNTVDNMVQVGLAPQALSTLVDTVIKDFFARPLTWGVVPWPGNGSIFYYAPPIWVETHFNDCVSASGDTISPAGSVDPVTNKAQLVDSSYMPDLYLAIDGKYVDKYGNPSNGAPVQAGDWPDFAASPLAASPSNSPWNICYIGPTTPLGDGSDLSFVSRRDGNPWNLPMLNPGDLSSQVSFC